MWLTSFLLIIISTNHVILADDVMNGTMKLIMVHALWRHGDRTPTETYHNDRFTEDFWIFGGGGWGQLTPIGMRQLMELGKKIRSRYIEGKPYKFLSSRYNQQEVYIRSTDRNRTLLSAAASMVGMYSSSSSSKKADNFNQADVDYPAVDGWPVGFVPIPIHTIEAPVDHLIDVDNHCPLQDTIWNLAKNTTIVNSYFNKLETLSLMENLTNYCGEDINPENLWILYNSLKIEKQYYPNIFQNMTPWYSDAIFDALDAVNDQVQDFQNGLGLDGVMSNGLDLGKTIKKIRGGTLVNDISNRMKRKADCLTNTGKECAYTNRNKFFAYSAHDTTLYALLSLLGVANYAVQPRGYPLYAACVLVEQWQDTTSNKTYFKMIFHRNDNDTLNNVITSGIPGCSSDYCDFEVFRNFSDTYKPDMEMNQWCDHDILKGSTYHFSIFFIFSLTCLLWILTL